MLTHSLSNSCNYEDIYELVSGEESATELLALQSEQVRPTSFKDFLALPKIVALDDHVFLARFDTKTSKNGTVFLTERSSGTEVWFTVTGFIARSYLPVHHILYRFRDSLDAVNTRVEITASNNIQFEESLGAIHRIYRLMEQSHQPGNFRPLQRSRLGDNLESIVASTPLLYNCRWNEHEISDIPEKLDAAGHMRRFIDKGTHAFTCDNDVTFAECVVNPDVSSAVLSSFSPEKIRVGQLVELLVSFRGFPVKKGRHWFGTHLHCIRVANRQSACRLADHITRLADQERLGLLGCKASGEFVPSKKRKVLIPPKNDPVEQTQGCSDDSQMPVD